MSLTAKEQFRLGFLIRCAEEGCTPDEIKARVKLAFVLREQRTAGVKTAAGWWKALKAYGLSPIHAAMFGIGGAGIAGAGAGYGLAKMQEEHVDPDEAKNQELVAAYKAQADRVRKKMQLSQYRPPKLKSPQLFPKEDNTHAF